MPFKKTPDNGFLRRAKIFVAEMFIEQGKGMIEIWIGHGRNLFFAFGKEFNHKIICP
ncbi:hypothetical protein HMPREF1985_00624 [Mitsuokella sp. oral taxon 131 str. W9106]|nr:hypothetical protein HMPREF1985_00624 [Mitsuokella sp. oral taxon 131 str. W9106]